MTRSVPLIMKVPFSVIMGISPKYTSCSFTSRMVRELVSGSTSHTINCTVIFKGTA